MALSGRRDFNLTADEIINMAVQSAGGGPLDGEQLKSYNTLLNFVQRDLLNRGIPLALICYMSIPLVQGEQFYELDCIIDIHNAVLETIQNNTETTLRRLSYAEFNQIPNKLAEGRPSIFMTERQYNEVIIRVCQEPKMSTLVYNVVQLVV